MSNASARLPFSAYRGLDPYVFVSYSHADARDAYPLMNELYNTGINIWYDEGISAGARWRDEIAHAIENASALLFFLSSHSVKSADCWSEVNFAIDANIPILTVQMEDAPMGGGLRLALADRQAVRLFGDDRQTGFDQMLHWLEREIHSEGRITERALPLPQSVLDTYNVSGRVGESDFVFRGYDTRAKRWVAIVSKPNAEDTDWQALLAGLETRRRIMHASLPVVHDAFLAGSSLIIVYEFVTGERLDSLCRRNPGVLTTNQWSLLRNITSQVLNALKTLHEVNLSHESISSHNLFIKPGGRAVLVGDESAKASYRKSNLAELGELILHCVDVCAPAANAIPEELINIAHELANPQVDLDRVLHILSERDTRERTNFIGRTDELNQLLTGFASIRQSAPGLLAINGESGIGKSALLRAFLNSVRQTSIVLEANCYPGNTKPFNAFEDIALQLSNFLNASPNKQAMLPRNVGVLGRLFPSLAGIGGDDDSVWRNVDPMRVKEHALIAMRELLGRISDSHQLIIAFDDFHWSDVESRELLREIMVGIDAPKLLCLLVYRDEHDAGAAIDRISDMARWNERLTIQPLSQEDAEDIANTVITELPAATLDKLISEAEGSPLLLELLLANAAQAATTEQEVNSNQILGERIASLGESEQHLVELVAIATLPVTLRLLAELLPDREGVPNLIQDLVEFKLLRYATISQGVSVEMHHHRIRTAVLAQMTEQQKRNLNRAIAEALIRSGSNQYSVRARHLIDAGDLGRGFDELMSAAQQAAEQLAFASAVQFYEEALSIRDDQSPQIYPKLAEALIQSGHPALGSEKYLVAASLAENEAERISYTQYAAFHSTVSGHFDQGRRLFKTVLNYYGIYYPRDTSTALRGFIRLAKHIGSRGLAYAERPAAATNDHLEVIDRIARSLLETDNVRGAYFAALGLARALDHGGHTLVMRALDLAYSTGLLEVAGNHINQLSANLLQAERTAAEQRGDLKFLGRSLINSAQFTLTTGDWAETADLASRGLSTIRSTSLQYPWDSNTGTMIYLRAVSELGELSTHIEQCNQLLREAERRGDFYAGTVAKLSLAFDALAQGNSHLARNLTEEVAGLWSGVSIAHHQSIYIDRVLVMCDLYDNRTESAAEIMENLWPKLSASKQLSITMVRVDFALLAIRVKSAIAWRNGQIPAIERELNALSRVTRPDAAGFVAMCNAATARFEGDAELSASLLREAIQIFDARSMRMTAALARVRLFEIDGIEHETSRSAAIKDLMDRGVRNPERWVDVMVPFPAINRPLDGE